MSRLLFLFAPLRARTGTLRQNKATATRFPAPEAIIGLECGQKNLSTHRPHAGPERTRRHQTSVQQPARTK